MLTNSDSTYTVEHDANPNASPASVGPMWIFASRRMRPTRFGSMIDLTPLLAALAAGGGSA